MKKKLSLLSNLWAVTLLLGGALTLFAFPGLTGEARAQQTMKQAIYIQEVNDCCCDCPYDCWCVIADPLPGEPGPQ